MKILVIEDEKELAKSISSYLSGENYHCEFAASFPEAIEKIYAYEYECVLLDLMLPGGDGIKILKELKALNQKEGVIIISARNSIETLFCASISHQGSRKKGT